MGNALADLHQHNRPPTDERSDNMLRGTIARSVKLSAGTGANLYCPCFLIRYSGGARPIARPPNVRLPVEAQSLRPRQQVLMNQAKGIEILKCCQIPEDMTELAERLSMGLLPRTARS
jgi:hypothetical protein